MTTSLSGLHLNTKSSAENETSLCRYCHKFHIQVLGCRYICGRTSPHRRQLFLLGIRIFHPTTRNNPVKTIRCARKKKLMMRSIRVRFERQQQRWGYSVQRLGMRQMASHSDWYVIPTWSICSLENWPRPSTSSSRFHSEWKTASRLKREATIH